jgi:RNA-directed DNA polymerase
LVVNERVNLPRETRRWLRAVEHRTRLYKEAKAAPLGSLDYRHQKSPTLSESQLEGWRALRSMVARQSVCRQ